MFVKFSEFAPQPCFVSSPCTPCFVSSPRTPCFVSSPRTPCFVSSPCTPCFVSSPPHALKGQKLLAQGNALGINSSQQGAL